MNNKLLLILLLLIYIEFIEGNKINNYIEVNS